MKEPIRWNTEGINVRKAVCELVGWRTQKGRITKRGEEIARTCWEDLTPAARTVLTQHGILPA